ncbi:glycosyltransferase [Paraglaciecola sp. 25GB23A]|uniref:glycosyltransferase n=1 Tax=Paraglaciecola sp. 25GB23A TaxID=3156068 RepID=UPI0032AFEA50
MNKKIVVDMAVLAQGVKTGVYRVAHELVNFLIHNEHYDVVFTLSIEKEFLRQHNVNLRDGLERYVEETGFAAPFVTIEFDPAFVNADYYLTPFFSVPENWANEQRVTKLLIAYDLIPIISPEYCEKGIVDLVSEFYHHIQNDWQVFAISECTKQDLLKFRPELNAENITVLYLGADDNYKPNILLAVQKAVRAKYYIPEGKSYFLSVATLEIRKNLETTVKAFAEFVNKNPDNEALLVLTGMNGWKLDKLKAELNKWPKIIERVIFTGFVDELDLPALYSGAEAFIYLSYYEGFGLPPLEAMSCGIPVISSNSSSLPEVIGDAGILVAATDFLGASLAFNSIINSKDMRDKLSAKSIERAKLFSWQKFGQEFIKQLDKTYKQVTPYLSIITICYNEEQIKDTCESILKQSFQYFEWIVVDGGSNDATLAILEKYKHRMNVFISEKDNGRYDAMNKGIKKSSGKYLLFLNGGDCLYQPDTIKNIFSFSVPFGKHNIFNNPFFEDILYGEVVTQETGLMPYPAWKTGAQSHDLSFFVGSSLPHQATFIKKALFDQFGLYDLSYQYAGDYEWFMRVLLKEGAKSQYLPAIISTYNFDGASSQSPAADAPHILEIKRAYDTYNQPVIGSTLAKQPQTNTQHNNIELCVTGATSHSLLSNIDGVKKYADLDYFGSLLSKSSKYLTLHDITVIGSYVEILFHSRFSKKHLIAIDFLKSTSVAAGALYTYIHRLSDIIMNQKYVIDSVPYMRVAFNIRGYLKKLQRNHLDMAFDCQNDFDDKYELLIKESYIYLLGRKATHEEINNWKNTLSEHIVTSTSFFSAVNNSEEARKYIDTSNQLSLEKGHPILSPYSMLQKALRNHALNNKYSNKISVVN